MWSELHNVTPALVKKQVFQKDCSRAHSWMGSGCMAKTRK